MPPHISHTLPISLPQILTPLHFDHRPHPHPLKQSKTLLKIISYNLERGYRLAEIIASLKEIDADVLLLQEIDVACMRSGVLDCVEEISKALGMGEI